MGNSINLDLVPSIVMDKSVVGELHIFDAWRESVRGIYDVTPNLDGGGVFESLKAWLVDSLIFSEITISSQTLKHNRSHLDKASNYLLVQVYRSGECRGIIEDRSFEILPASVHIFDFSRECHSIAQDSTVAGVIVPHEVVGYDPDTHPPYFSFPAGSAITQLLTQTIFTVLEQAPSLNKMDAYTVRECFSGLLQNVLSLSPVVKPETSKNCETRRQAMKAFLDKNLTDPDLCAEVLSEQFGTSLPTIYRYFSEFGGVQRYIVQRRMNRAYSQLVSPMYQHKKIHEIANSLGYDDAAHFSRTFSQHFGYPPSMVKNKSQPCQANLPDERKFAKFCIGDWFRAINCDIAVSSRVPQTG